MLLTEEEMQTLTQVGPGTPGGELLRRYWHPIAGLHQLTDEAPTAYVRLLGEDLVLFRDRSGRVGLLADHCPHRGASLLYGRVEERGIACAYHGWLYDTRGNCLECPAEPAGSQFHLTVKHRAYPVEKYFGLYWAYLGPEPVPSIRRLDIDSYPIEHLTEFVYDCSWVQVMENHVDGTHISILHQDTTGRSPARNTTRGRIDQQTTLAYQEWQFGIRRKMVSEGNLEDDEVVFPNWLRRTVQLHVNVPVDDTHTKKFLYGVLPDRDESQADDDEPANYWITEPGYGKSGPGIHPNVRHRMDSVHYQDIMAGETQGPISHRQNWHPATSDSGVVLFERMLLREIRRVQAGHDPLAVLRDPSQVIDTNFEFYRQSGDIELQRRPEPQGMQVHARAGAHSSPAIPVPAGFQSR